MTATYSPDDNKLRLYPTARLDPDTYARVRAAGFRWAPKQELFVAPAWTPEREDLLLELAGDIQDEDTSLVERAEGRADRFTGLQERRLEESEGARQAADRIASGIPFGQPILVGHHSERRARRDAERIHNGLHRSVELWRTAQYWQERATAAIRHAKYHERPDVRARRIKAIESEARKNTRVIEQLQGQVKGWRHVLTVADQVREGVRAPEQLRSLALLIANGGHNYDRWSRLERGELDVETAAREAIESCERTVAVCIRWAEHFDSRLAYERAMLADAGGTVADRTGPEQGGACKCWASHRGGWSYIQKVNKVSVTVQDNWGNGGANFTRTIPFDKLAAVMTKADVDAARQDGRLVEADDKTGFFLVEAAKEEQEV